MSDTPDVPHTAVKPGSFLSVKRAGLPTWTWIVIGLAAAYVLFRYYKSRNSASVSTSSTTDSDSGASTDSGAASGAGAALADSSVGSVSPSDGQTSGSVASDSGYSSTSQWGASTAAYLESTGVSPIDAANAVSNYLNGLPVTGTQAGLLNTALGSVGTPPGGIIPVTVEPTPATTPAAPTTTATPTPTPTPKPKPSDVAFTIYTTKKGQDLEQVARLSYGKSTSKEVAAIAKASHVSDSATAKLKAGTRLKIPHTIS